MAKVLQSYSLCPLIEEEKFLGITEDIEDGQVLVTINSNMVCKLILSNAKQIHCWSTTGLITSPVIYAQSVDRYVGIFNRNLLRMWDLSTINIDKVKRYRFVAELHSSVNIPGTTKRTLVIFKDGHFCDLNEAISNRHTIIGKSNLLRELERVRKVDVISFGDLSFVSLLTELDEVVFRLHVIPLTNDNDDDCDELKPFNFNLISKYDRNSRYVNHCFVVTDKCCSLITLWSSGKLFITRIFSDNDNDREKLFPGQCLTYVPINTDYDVLMRPLSPHDVAVYGANKDGDSSLFLFSLKYNALQSLACYKKFANPPYFWNLASNLFIIVGSNLIVIPFTLKNQKLSTLVGIYKPQSLMTIFASDETTNNNDDVDEDNNNPSSESKHKINETLIWSLLKSKDTLGLLQAIKSCIDISDDVIIDVLKLCLTDIPSYDNVLQALIYRYTLMDSSKLEKIPLELILVLMNELMNRFHTTFENQRKVLKWLSAILDVFYPQYMKGRLTVINDTLLTISKFLNDELKRYEDFKELTALSSVIRRKMIIWCKK